LIIAAFVAAVAVVVVVIAVAGGGDGGASKPSSPVDPFKPGAAFAQPDAIRIDGDQPAEIFAKNTPLTVNGDGAEKVTVGGGQAYLAGADATPRMTGPTLLARRGGTVNITLHNELQVYDGIESAEDCKYKDTKDQVTNFHFHGLRVTPETRKIDGVTVVGDNVLIDLLPNRKTRIEFEIPRDHEQGTFWYHAHRHGCTDDQVSRGLAGLLFIGDSRTALPQRFHRIQTRDLMLQDLQVVKGDDGGYAIDPGHFWHDPTNRLVNGLAQPNMTIAPGETQLWRIANASAGVWFNLALLNAPKEAPDGDPNDPAGFTVVAEDGNTLEDSREVSSYVLGPGDRVDVLVTGSMHGEKRTLATLQYVQGEATTFPQEMLATLSPTDDEPQTPLGEPGRLKRLPPLAKERGPNREFTFFLGKPGLASRPDKPAFTINGQTFSHDSPAQATPTVGTTERWTVKNASDQAHPFHIHQGDFRVRSVNGKPVDTGGQQDTVELPMRQADGSPGEIVFDMSFLVEGDFVFHCHILDHEDLGMMARVSVTDGK
jgi:suppressor of ftsI